MRINEILTIKYNSELNPNLWDNEELKPKVRLKLLQISKKFIEYLNLDSLIVQDVVITGSSANYNWTELSDIDLHIIVDMEHLKQQCPEMVADFFLGKNALWNKQHDIKMYDHAVELYVQDAQEEHVSAGFYSVLNNTWIIKPEYSVPSYNSAAVEAKTTQLQYEIEELVNINADIFDVKQMKSKLKSMRKSGLLSAGEFSTENLVFKQLRYSGHLKMLSDYAKDVVNKKYSLDDKVFDKPKSSML